MLDTFKDDNGSSFREAASAVGFSAATAQARSYAVPSAAHADLKRCMHLAPKAPTSLACKCVPFHVADLRVPHSALHAGVC